jgi:Zn/Cd-binding protein ZinT
LFKFIRKLYTKWSLKYPYSAQRLRYRWECVKDLPYAWGWRKKRVDGYVRDPIILQDEDGNDFIKPDPHIMTPERAKRRIAWSKQIQESRAERLKKDPNYYPGKYIGRTEFEERPKTVITNDNPVETCDAPDSKDLNTGELLFQEEICAGADAAAERAEAFYRDKGMDEVTPSVRKTVTIVDQSTGKEHKLQFGGKPNAKEEVVTVDGRKILRVHTGEKGPNGRPEVLETPVTHESLHSSAAVAKVRELKEDEVD